MRTPIIVVFLLLLTVGPRVVAQGVVKHYNPDSLPASYFDQLKNEFGANKHYPAEFEKAILVALSHYPELKNTPIEFVTRPNHSLGFTRVTWVGLFEKPRTRHYLIVISDYTEPMLMPLLFKHLSFNALLGALGHELAHVADFQSKTTWDIIGHAVKNVSARYIDRFEFNTDAICIAHGLGYQLLEWSSFVRATMHTVNWLGPDYAHRPKNRERYMNPSTISARMKELPMYE